MTQLSARMPAGWGGEVNENRRLIFWREHVVAPVFEDPSVPDCAAVHLLLSPFSSSVDRQHRLLGGHWV